MTDVLEIEPELSAARAMKYAGLIKSCLHHGTRFHLAGEQSVLFAELVSLSFML